MRGQRLHNESGLRPSPEGEERGEGRQGLRPVLCCGQRACQTLHPSLVLSTTALGLVSIVNLFERVGVYLLSAVLWHLMLHCMS